MSAHGSEGKGDKRRHGGALGLTPAKVRVRNLNMTKEEEITLATADRLDQLNTGVQRSRGKPKKNSRRAEDHAAQLGTLVN